jgi:hypothetical protein
MGYVQGRCVHGRHLDIHSKLYSELNNFGVEFHFTNLKQTLENCRTFCRTTHIRTKKRRFKMVECLSGGKKDEKLVLGFFTSLNS